MACGAGGAPPPSALSPRAPEVIRVIDGPVSMYLVRGPDDAVVAVDCGMDPEGTSVREALSARGLAPTAVRAVLITHLHGDHVGGCDLFADAPRYGMAGLDEFPVIPIRDGVPFVVAGLTITPYAVPGHSADSVAYRIGEAVFLGDAATLDADHRVVASRMRFEGATPVPDESGANEAALVRLATQLAAAGGPIAHLYFGHADPTADVEQLLARRR